jgi:dTDP-4-amino-4,6-dideoxygalactose transaminase
MRCANPDEIVGSRRRNFEHLVSRLDGRLALPFATLPAGTCPFFLPVMVPDKAPFIERLGRLDIHAADWWAETHPTCAPEFAREVASWRRHCLELPIHQGLQSEDIDRLADAVLRVADEVGG